MISLALYQPDIPQNVGAAMRLCACLGAELHIIEPCAFPWDDRKIKQAAMDYVTKVNYNRFISWERYRTTWKDRRVILMTTKTQTRYTEFAFRPDDILLAGSESAGVPESVHQACMGCVTIPLQPALRSFNVINASAMILGEALRQTQWRTP